MKCLKFVQNVILNGISMMARSARVVINQKKSILSQRLISSEGELLVPGKIQQILKMCTKR